MSASAPRVRPTAHGASLPLLALAALALAACGDSSTGPGAGSEQLAQRLQTMGTTIARTDPQSGMGLMLASHALAAGGRVGTVAVTVDGASRRMSAVGVEMAPPPPPPGAPPCDPANGCVTFGFPTTELLVAWEGDGSSPADRILVVMSLGTGEQRIVDLTAPLVDTSSGDQPGLVVSDPLGGAVGAVLTRGDTIQWSATSGTATSAVVDTTGSCPTRTSAAGAPALRSCREVDFRFAATMRLVERAPWRWWENPDAPPPPAGPAHDVTLAAQLVPGVAIVPDLAVPLLSIPSAR